MEQKKPTAKIVVQGDNAVSPQKPKEGGQQSPPVKDQPKRKKMRDVTQAKKQAYFEATNRVINAKTAKKTDLMLCVKESQMQFAQLIISNFKVIDVIDLRGLEETVIIKKEP